MDKVVVFLIGLLIPASKPCLPAIADRSIDLWAGLSAPCLQSLPALEPKLKFINFFLRLDTINDLQSLIGDLKPFLPYSDYLLGRQKPITYLVLLQNNYEMRANGGFFGSYVKLKIENDLPADATHQALQAGKLKTDFQDIYVPDGAIIGHVDPPAPIQTAFKQGWFRLRDADWEPDFPTAAKTIRWFLEKGDEVNPDFLITLNLTAIEKLMKIVGEVDVPEYKLKLDSDNLYALLQNEAEISFFPGSTQKRDALTAVGKAITKKLTSLQPKQYLAIIQILIDTANKKNLLINSNSPEIQNLILSKNWAGQLIRPTECEDCLRDAVLLVEANLGANKANCCVERKTIHTITKSETDVSHLIDLTFTNNSPVENPIPPRFFGGNYIAYLRYYLPENARNIRLTAQPTLPKTLSAFPAPFDGVKEKTFDLKFNYGMREIGFFHTTAAGTRSAIQLSYDLPISASPTYQLGLFKQNGMENSPSEINLFGKTFSTNLETNYSISTGL